MEEALAAYLLAYTSLTALVSDHVYWVTSPQGQGPPFVLLTTVSGIRDTTFQGANGLIESRVQVDCYDLSYANAKLIARAVEARLSGVKVTYNGIVFDGCFLVAERDSYESSETPDKYYRDSLDFMIWHKGA